MKVDLADDGPSVGRPGPQVLVGDAYHRRISASPRPVRIRARFQALIGGMLAPGAEVLDFGAGTGIDARFLADHGHRVRVFEPDPAMLAHLRVHCADAIGAGSVSVVADMADVAPVDAIIANFAVLNLVEDRAVMFRQLHGALRPGGFVLASLLNPWAARDMRHGWWWRNLPALALNGGYALPGASGAVERVTARVLAREAAPWFRLACLTPGGPATTRYPYLFVRLDRKPC